MLNDDATTPVDRPSEPTPEHAAPEHTAPEHAAPAELPTGPTPEPASPASPATDPGLVRLRLDIAYDGTDFHGWAAQGGQSLRTVQGVLEDALGKVLRVPCRLTVAGRTDAGVHALGQVAHVDVPLSSLDTRSIAGDPRRLVRRLARLLPDDVSLRDCGFAPEGFDARFSALRRHYVYRLTTADAGPLPLRARDTATWPKKLDLGLLQSSAEVLLGLHDFAAFCKPRPNATTIRDLQAFEWRDVSTPEEPELYEARVTADAFCWSMVRSLVGGCVATAEGRRPADFTEGLLDERQRSPLVPVAPAKGLALAGVDYPDDADLAARADATRGIRVLPGEEHRAEGKGCPERNPYFGGGGNGGGGGVGNGGGGGVGNGGGGGVGNGGVAADSGGPVT